MSAEILTLHNIEHRVGRFGYVFKKVCGQWTKSNHTEAEVKAAIILDIKQRNNYKDPRPPKVRNEDGLTFCQ